MKSTSIIIIIICITRIAIKSPWKKSGDGGQSKRPVVTMVVVTIVTIVTGTDDGCDDRMTMMVGDDVVTMMVVTIVV